MSEDPNFLSIPPEVEFSALPNQELSVPAPSSPPGKPLADRATELLFHWIACNVRPATVQNDDEELAREAVRWCRALEAEAAQATKRPEPKPRAARIAPEDEEAW